MLNHHPDVAVPLESIFLIDYLKAEKKISIETQKRFLVHEPMLKEWGIKLDSRKLKKAKNISDLINLIHQEYADLNGKKYWGNKTPRMTRYGALIKKKVKEIKFVHLIRDPRATALSLTNSVIHKSNVYYGARRWERHVGAGIELEKKYPKDVLRIYFEDLVTSPEKELRKICKFLNLRYSSAMFNYLKTGNQEYRKYHQGVHKNLNKKPDLRRIDYWKDKLSRREIEIIESVCGDLMQEVPYEPMFEKTNLKKADIYYYRLNRIYNFLYQTKRFLFYWPEYLFYTLLRKAVFGTFIEEIRGINY